MPNYLWRNLITAEIKEVQCLIRDRNVPPDDSGEWKRVLEAPMVMNAAFPDGVRKDMTDFKKIAKLQAAAADLPKGASDRAEIGREIADRKRIK